MIDIIIDCRNHNQTNRTKLKNVIINDFDDKLNVFFDYFFYFNLNQIRKIDQNQLKSKTIFDFDIQNIFDKIFKFENKFVVDIYKSRCFVH